MSLAEQRILAQLTNSELLDAYEFLRSEIEGVPVDAETRTRGERAVARARSLATVQELALLGWG